MKKVLFTALLSISTLLSAYVDSDMDGVDDSIDRCPNTSFNDLADINGCTIKSLLSEHHFDLIIGTSYANPDYQTLSKTDTVTGSLQVDYYYKNFSAQLSTSYFSTNGNDYSNAGMYDSFVGGSYNFKLTKSLQIRVNAGALLPTYTTSLNNNNTDYTSGVNLSYTFENANIFGAYSYTLINDDDIVGDAIVGDVTYQNTNALSGGIGYYVTDKLYMSGAYNVSDSLYSGVDKVKTASVYANYSIDEHWFSNFSYAHGLSDTASKTYASIRLGYLF